MKKLFYLLLALPLAFFASCSSDNDLPQVDLTITLSGVTQYDNTFYAVQGDETSNTEASTTSDESDTDSSDTTTVSDDVVTIDSFTATSLTNKSATVANSVFYIDGRPLMPTYDGESFIITIPTASLGVGTHTVSVTANVLQVDKSIANAALDFPLIVVASSEDLPDGAPAIGTYSLTVRNESK